MSKYVCYPHAVHQTSEDSSMKSGRAGRLSAGESSLNRERSSSSKDSKLSKPLERGEKLSIMI